MWIVYTEIHDENGVERWYYGRWDDHNKANEVAIELNNNRGSKYPVCSCVCHVDNAEKLGIMNMYN